MTTAVSNQSESVRHIGTSRIDERGDYKTDGIEAPAPIGLLPRPHEKGERERDADDERDHHHHGFLPAPPRRLPLAAAINAKVNSRWTTRNSFAASRASPLKTP
jgi:hypothetical protein